jgi:hypothetical protein
MADPLMQPALIRLTHEESDSRVLIDDGKDRFGLTVAEAIEACQRRDEVKGILERQNLFRAQIELLLTRLQEWVNQHKSGIRDAFFQLRRDRQLLLVVLRGYEYDATIENALTDLTLEVSGDEAFSMLRLDVQAMPNCDIDDVRSFIDVNGSRVHGDFSVAR